MATERAWLEVLLELSRALNKALGSQGPGWCYTCGTLVGAVPLAQQPVGGEALQKEAASQQQAAEQHQGPPKAQQAEGWPAHDHHGSRYSSWSRATWYGDSRWAPRVGKNHARNAKRKLKRQRRAGAANQKAANKHLERQDHMDEELHNLGAGGYSGEAGGGDEGVYVGEWTELGTAATSSGPGACQEQPVHGEEEDGGFYVVEVKTMNDKLSNIDVEAGRTVRQIQAQVQESLGIPLDKQRLLFAGKLLEMGTGGKLVLLAGETAGGIEVQETDTIDRIMELCTRGATLPLPAAEGEKAEDGGALEKSVMIAINR